MTKRKDKTSSTPQTPVAPPETTEEKVVLSVPKKILLIAVLCLLPVLLLGVLEVGLRVSGYGYPTGLFIPSENEEMLRSNPQFTWRFFPPAISRPPVWQVFPKDKPENAYRIFVVGGSAAQGVPAPSLGFARILEVMLEESYPQTDFEVINVAITAVNSHVVLPVVRDCAKQDPDLFIVFMGNNEVVGPFGPGAGVGGDRVPSLRFIRTRLAVLTTKGGQLMQSITRAMQADGPTEWRGMEMFAKDHVTADDPRLQVVYDLFGQNLTDICDIADEAGVPMLVCTVPVNLLDCPPFASEHRGGLTEAQCAQWQASYDVGVSAESTGQFSAAIDAYLQAAAVDAGYADLQYRLGRCYLAIDQHDQAVRAFELARDRDVLRFRADAQINQTIREIVTAHANSGVDLVDLELRFANVAATPDLPGRGLFFEHVHMTFLGNYHVAAAAYDSVLPILPERITQGEHPALMSMEQVRRAMPVALWDEMTMLNGMLALANRPPFTGQLDHLTRLKSLLADNSELRSRLILGEAQQVADLYRAAFERRPEDVDLALRYTSFLATQKRFADAEPILRAIVRQFPDNETAWQSLAHAAIAQGHYEEARQVLIQLERISEMPEATLYETALSAEKLKHPGFALECLERILELSPDMAFAHELKGNCLMDQGKYWEAVEALRESVRLAPGSPVAQLSLAWALWSAGETDEATTVLATAIELDPLHAESRQMLALVYATQEQYDRADEQFELAIRLHPYAESGYLIYIESLLQRDDYARAKRIYESGIEKLPASFQLLRELTALCQVAPEPVRDYEQAIVYGERLVELTGRQDLPALMELAAAYGEMRRFEEAISTLDEAVAIARSAGNQGALSALGIYRRAFLEGKPLSDLVSPSQ